jgi:ribosomal-protein-alanine N-acetyltransferase
MNPERIFDYFPELQVDDDYVLRQYTHNDVEDYYKYMQDKDVVRYVPKECIPKSIEGTRAEIEYALDLFRYKRSIYWAIARKKDNTLVGSCGFNYWNRDHARAEISYDLAKEYWNKGIMTKVVRAVLAFAFTQMQMHRIEATVTPTNIGSLTVLKKVGFKKEGVLRDQKLLHGKFYDAVMLSLLSREFFSVR